MASRQSLRNELAELERLSLPLEPDAAARQRLLHEVWQHASKFLAQTDLAPTYSPATGRASLISNAGFSERGRNLSRVLALVREIDRAGYGVTSPRYFGYIPAGGLFHSALGNFLAAVSNRYVGIDYVAPVAVQVENSVVSWLARVIGLPEGAHGTLTSGGSMGNLIGIAIARDRSRISPKTVSRNVLYHTGQYHKSSVEKALRLLGLGSLEHRKVPVDEQYRMRSDVLENLVVADKKRGLRPWLVIATAGTTNSGAVDPLAKIGLVCKRHSLWFHVDGAYGGLFTLAPEARDVLSGIDQADSITLDPHKTLFLPYGTGAVLVREGWRLRRTFLERADYLSKSSSKRSPADVSPELTRPFRALGLWLPLQLAGVAAFRAALSEKILLARHFHRRMSVLRDFEVGPFPDLSIVTFRFVPPGRRNIDAVNEKLADRLKKRGKVLLTSTTLNNRKTLRFAVLSFRTHLRHVEQAINEITSVAASI